MKEISFLLVGEKVFFIGQQAHDILNGCPLIYQLGNHRENTMPFIFLRKVFSVDSLMLSLVGYLPPRLFQLFPAGGKLCFKFRDTCFELS